MVSLFMVFVIFGSLLPVMLSVQQSLHAKKERVSAYETLHEAARQISSTETASGHRTVNGTVYNWQLADQLCVEYADYQGDRVRVCAN